MLGWLALAHVGLTRVAASLLTSKPGLVAAALALMCAAMFARAIAWHAILRAAPTWRRAKRRDAMQGTFIGVLMSATLPGRLGEPSRALIVARRLGRARETLPLVLGTIVSQTLLNLFALALLAGATLARLDREPLGRHHGALIAIAFAPLAALLLALLAPLLLPAAAALAAGADASGWQRRCGVRSCACARVSVCSRTPASACARASRSCARGRCS